VDFHEEFKNHVIDYFCSGYMNGLTPNPCIICNEKIKFGTLLKKADALGADFIATGHFALVNFDKRSGRFNLREGKDKKKDQSYFLSRLDQEQLSRALFPLGRFTKEKVRALARKFGLKTHDRPSSQDICFAQKNGYSEIIKERFSDNIKPGNITDEYGNIMGRHKGYPFYTIGQRHGLGVAHKEPLYVLKIDKTDNRIIVGPRGRTKQRAFIVERLNYVSIPQIKSPIRASVKIRYNHKKSGALITKSGGDEAVVEFDEPQFSITPGQAAVFYKKGVVLAGGWIREVLA